jgi:pyridoxal phosphate enzyme (YggS family)
VTRAEEIAAALTAVRARIADAAARAGRSFDSVRLVAVSKKMAAADVIAAGSAGQLDFGENYAQELRDKREALAGAAAGARWHFIGPLQSNKVKLVAGRVELIHSIDSEALLDEIDRRGQPQACLVQVNVAAEAHKRGLPPAALPALLDRFAASACARCLGLMVIPPLLDDPEASRPHFAALRALRDREASRPRRNVALSELSMGMSHDLEAAIAEGATLVRVGTAIFGARR